MRAGSTARASPRRWPASPTRPSCRRPAMPSRTRCCGAGWRRAEGLNLAAAGAAVGAEEAHPARIEGQLLQRAGDAGLVGMAFDVGVEFGRLEGAAALVAFQLGHVDAVGGEAAQRLEQ